MNDSTLHIFLKYELKKNAPHITVPQCPNPDREEVMQKNWRYGKHLQDKKNLALAAELSVESPDN